MKRFGISAIAFVLFTSLLFPSLNANAASFPDVTADYWAKKEIDFLTNKGIINGFPDGTFGPEKSIKRIQVATMIVRALNLSTANRPDPKLKDVTKSSYGYDIIATVADEGIMTGNTQGYFNPNGLLTRAQMSKVLVEAYDLVGTWEKDFTDVPKTEWYYPYVETLAANGISIGYVADNTFKPKNLTKRSQFASFMARTIDPSFRPATTVVVDSQFISLASQGKIKPIDSIALEMTSAKVRQTIGQPIATDQDDWYIYDSYEDFDLFYNLEDGENLEEIYLYGSKVDLTVTQMKSVLGAPLEEYQDAYMSMYLYEAGSNYVTFYTDEDKNTVTMVSIADYYYPVAE